MDEFSILNGEPVTLSEAYIASWNGDGTYGDDAVDGSYVRLYGVTEATLTSTGVSAQRFGDGGKLLASYGRNVGATLSITWAGDLSALALLLNASLVTEGSGENAVRKFRLNGSGRTYVGFIGAADLDTGVERAVHLFAPKAQVSGDSITVLSWSGGQEAEFGTVTMELVCLPDDNFLDGETEEIHLLTLGSPTTGNYTLTFAGATTTPLAHNANAAAIEAALEALPAIGTGNVSVAAATPSGFDITFTGRYANKKVALLVPTEDGTFDGTAAVVRDSVGEEGDALIAAVYEVPAGLAPTLPPSYGA